MSPPGFAEKVRTHILKEWYFTDDSTQTEICASMSPTYATHLKHALNAKL